MDFPKWVKRLLFGTAIIAVVYLLAAATAILIYRHLGRLELPNRLCQTYQDMVAISAISSLAGISASIFVVLKLHGKTWSHFGLKFSGHSIREALIGMGIGFSMQLLWALALVTLGAWQFKGFGTEFYKAEGILNAAAWSFIFCVCAVAFEEIFFRGYLQQALAEKMKVDYAIVSTGIIFGLCHINKTHSLCSGIDLALMGILLGYAFMLYRSLWLPIFIHFTWNYSGILFFHNYQPAYMKSSFLLVWEQKPSWTDMELFLPLIILDIAAIAALAYAGKIRRRRLADVFSEITAKN